MRKQILLFTLVGIFCAGLSTSLALRNKSTTVYADSNPDFVIAGNFDASSRGEWTNTPTAANRRFTKCGDNDYQLNNVHMKTYTYGDFRVLPYGSWSQDYGYNQIYVNEPGFTASGTDNNIHIAVTGYYDLRLYNGKIYITKHDSESRSTLEIQIWKDNVKTIESSFDCTFTYNDDQTKSFSSLDSTKRLSVKSNSKFYINSYTMPDGYYLSDYRLGYTDNTTQYYRPDPSFHSHAIPHYRSGDNYTSCINYIILYFWTSTESARKDTPFIVAANNEVNTFFNDCDVGIFCYGGGITTPVTIKVDRLNTCLLGTTIVPKGTLYMEVIRTNSGSLPCTGLPSTIHNRWSRTEYNSTKNVIKITSWDGGQDYSDNKVVLLKDRPAFFDTQDSAFWFADNAVAYAVTGALSNWYGYTASTGWNVLTRINTSGYIYFVPSATIIAPHVIITRNDPSGSGWDKKWNQTTDITVNYGYNPLYTTMVETGMTEGKYNWGNKSAVETASEYGYYFMDKITCSGGGSITSPSSNWEVVSNMYSKLTADVQNEIFKASADEHGEKNIEKAMARYDYIVFFKAYSGYSDFIHRGQDGSGRSLSRNINFFEMYSISMDYITLVSVIFSASLVMLLTVLVIKKRSRHY